MMIAMIRNPGARCAGAIETCKENQICSTTGLQLNSAMSKSPMITNGRSKSAAACSSARQPKNTFQPGKRKQYQSGNSQDVNGNDVNHYPERFSPSAFHHGKVHGCFSANADLLIQEISSLDTKVRNTSMDAQLRRSKKLCGRPFCDLLRYANRRTKMCRLRELHSCLSDGRHFDRSHQEPRAL